ncbi:prepilin-type N-terminal cleavage/methylation domain-containing protein [Psychrobium sp. MM17-31]|uniref:type II secretion system protein n=1 Tax=Psychrobium sp. MM17-31 TaxID=2917758 RepID=UPI001EF64DFF|nr:prepilin-type N-terminal cleavage/methylation domain-containing protein [Psychrobium sp. MM17-31]MCG7532355.1 prepilin-type N-terminal cleavage/methylation domain-containing protein [Psychrobium sp. MM17-31]
MKYSRAFTLIELIMVILIISVLAVTIVPKFFTSSEVEHFAVRDQLISQLRLAQLKSMNQIDKCHRVVIDSSGAKLAEMTLNTSVNPSVCNSSSLVVLQDSLLEFSETSVSLAVSSPPSILNIDFKSDNQGIGQCNGSAGCTIDIIGSETLQIKIESQGYIHAL